MLSESPQPNLGATTRPPKRATLAAVLIATAFFAAIAPTLRWLEFSGGSESLVTETVLEMRRGGPWFVPTLLGVPRMTKPPLTAWLTAAATRQATVAQLSSRDPATRDAAFRQLAWQIRWPSLLSSCAMLLATYALGRLLIDWRVGLAAAAVCGSTLLFLRFSRAATTDVQLALWVTVTNAFLVLAVLRRRPWPGYLGAGAALGMAFMSKGPVAFVQTLVPFVVFAVWRLIAGPAPYAAEDRSRRVRHWPALLAGVLVMLAVGLPWYLVVLRRWPDIVHGWWIEVTRVGATQLPPDPWYTYFTLLPWMLPWLAWFVAGIWVAGSQTFRPGRVSDEDIKSRDGTVLALMLTLAPVLVMSFFKDKNERYLLPMVAPAAVVTARAAVAWWRRPTSDVGGRAVDAVHWITLALLALGLPLVGLSAPHLDLGDRWFSPATAALFILAAVAILALGYFPYREKRGHSHFSEKVNVPFLAAARSGAAAPVAATAALMLLLQYPFLLGYRQMDKSDLKPLADAVWAQYPDATVHQFEPGHRTRVRMDLPIYLGRITRTIGREDLAKLAPSDNPQVVVFLERRSGTEHDLPAPWQELGTGGGRKGGWRAYVLPPVR